MQPRDSLILFLCVIVYSIVGHRLFAAIAPDKFGTFADSIYTVCSVSRASALLFFKNLAFSARTNMFKLN